MEALSEAAGDIQQPQNKRHATSEEAPKNKRQATIEAKTAVAEPFSNLKHRNRKERDRAAKQEEIEAKKQAAEEAKKDVHGGGRL